MVTHSPSSPAPQVPRIAAGSERCWARTARAAAAPAGPALGPKATPSVTPFIVLHCFKHYCSAVYQVRGPSKGKTLYTASVLASTLIKYLQIERQLLFYIWSFPGGILNASIFPLVYCNVMLFLEKAILTITYFWQAWGVNGMNFKFQKCTQTIKRPLFLCNAFNVYGNVWKHLILKRFCYWSI